MESTQAQALVVVPMVVGGVWVVVKVVEVVRVIKGEWNLNA